MPNVFIQYWSMRVMAYLAALVLLLALWGAWAVWRHRLERSRWFLLGRHLGGHRPVLHEHRRLAADRERPPALDRPGPDADQGRGVPTLSSTWVLITLVLFVVVYGVFGVVDGVLMVRYGRRELSESEDGEAARGRCRRDGAGAGRDPGLDLLGGRMGLQVFWFIIIAFFWTGFFILEGFDLGVGALHMVVGKTDLERRVAINSIGPFWDGNEVWLIVAGAATFAAFPAWYASMFSALYLAMMLVLLALIIRGVSFEYRGKIDQPRWRATWDWTLTIGSAPAARCCSASRSGTCCTGCR